MKSIIFVISILSISALIAGCAKKENEAAASPTPAPVVAQSEGTSPSDAVQSDDVTGSTDAAVSDDTAVSDETEEEYTIDGVWMTEDFTRIFTFMANESECVYIADGVNYVSDFSLDEDLLNIEYTNESFAVTELNGKNLILTDETGNETVLSRVSLTKTVKGVKADDYAGKWTCRIEDAENKTYFEIRLTLKSDMTATVRTDTSGKTEKITDLTWSVSKGKIILDNGSGSENAQLVFNILEKLDDNTFITAFEGTAAAFTRK